MMHSNGNILTLESQIRPESLQALGAKGMNLYLAYQDGVQVPRTVFLMQDDEFDNTVEQALSYLGPPPWVVRSSAKREDGHSRSYAGILLSEAKLTTTGDLKLAVSKVRESLNNARMKYYDGTSGSEAGMTVLIQPQLTGPGGVMLVSESGDYWVVEASAAGPAAVVSGSSHPDRFVQTTVGDQGVWIGEDSRRAWSEQPTKSMSSPLCISKAELLRVVQLGLSAIKLLEGPTDIEWILDVSGKLHLLQLRPLTTQFVIPV